MSNWRGIVVAALAAATLAAAATGLIVYEPETLTDSEADAARYPLEIVSFTDPQSVTLTLHPAEPLTLAAPRGGTVTRDRCTSIDELTTGTVIAEIDQRPVIAFRTKAPLFRDLTGNETGADVAAVQKELRALGYDAPSNERYDWLTKAAMNAFLRDHGLHSSNAEWGVLSLGTIVWVPAGDTAVEECSARVGDRLSDGDPLLHLASDPGTIEYTGEAASVDGERVLVIGDARIPAPGSPIDDAAAVREILATPEGAAAARREEKTLGAVLELAEPTDAYPVPPSALFGIDGAAACVSDGGAAHPVTIAASSLGLSYVTFDTAPPAAVDVFPDRATPCE